MMLDVKLLASINLAVQALLLVTILIAAYFARKQQLIRHCYIMRTAVIVQLLSIFSIMLPAMLGYVKNPRQPAFQTEMLIHHSLAVLVILLWVYVNLAVMGRVKVFGRLATFMKIAFTTWVLVFLLGLYLYLQVYILH
jgi:uncharacterized membrane protein YozB (DUF420 family)